MEFLQEGTDWYGSLNMNTVLGPFDVTNAQEFLMQVRDRPGGRLYASFSLSAGDFQRPRDGAVDLVILASAVSALVNKRLVYDVLVTIGGFTWPVINGAFFVNPGVSVP